MRIHDRDIIVIITPVQTIDITYIFLLKSNPRNESMVAIVKRNMTMLIKAILLHFL